MYLIRKAVIVDYARTPFGTASRKRPGFFADKRADDLGALVVGALLRRTAIDPVCVDEIIMGAVYQGGEQSSPGRGIGLMTLPFETAALSVERACCSSMTSAHVACMAIQLGMGDIFIAGGMESHSHFPAPLITADTDLTALVEEFGSSRGMPNFKIFDRIDINAVVSMGLIGERLADMYGITREEHDNWAFRSNMRAAAAQREGRFRNEIIPIEGRLPDGTVRVVDYDQGVRADSTQEKIRSLPPLYKPDGVICVASTSGENDGAAAAVLMSGDSAQELGLVPMASVKSMAWVGVDPKIMGYGAIAASRKALQRAGLAPQEIDLWEINEAFATLPLMQIKDMSLDPERVNVNGGAICIGHPVGASGMRVLGTLAFEMCRREARYGLAAICGAWGAGTATVLEREDYREGRRSYLDQFQSLPDS